MRRFLTSLFARYMIVFVAALILAFAIEVLAARAWYLQQTHTRLHEAAELLAFQLGPNLKDRDFDAVAALVAGAPAQYPLRMTIILPNGEVVADSDENAAVMHNHGDRPEIQEAARGRVGRAQRFSHTLQRELVYMAVPIHFDSELVGVARTALPLDRVQRRLRGLIAAIGAGTLAGLAFAALLALVLRRQFTQDVLALRKGVERYAGGDLHANLTTSEVTETSGLAAELEDMAKKLDRRIQTAVGQRNELQAVLSGMVEGVIAVDAEQTIMSINPAASAFFGVDRQAVLGRSAQEVIRNADLQRIIQRALSSDASVEGEIRSFGEVERSLHVRATALRNASDKRAGALLVLHDVTQLQRLENVRRDFVANVSHELRTPVTAIKGYVETLLDGAMDNPADARRFLEIVNRHSKRLNDIIEDLLALSRIEQGDREDFDMEVVKLRPILEGALQICLPQAAAKDMEVLLTCDPEIEARLNARLIEQAVVNLLQNAIAYSEPDNRVSLSASYNGEVRIAVKDHGRGIARNHIPRLFERFYRVDKARSRSEGGTGLGLAIVKHILILHHADITVESTPGKGSTFTIVLPAPDPQQTPR